jgi:hypothetical protein
MSYTIDQVSFLLLCLQCSGGKIDFAAVTKEYAHLHPGETLASNTAYMRFSRLKAKVEGEMDFKFNVSGGNKKGGEDGDATKKRKGVGKEGVRSVKGEDEEVNKKRKIEKVKGEDEDVKPLKMEE